MRQAWERGAFLKDVVRETGLGYVPVRRYLVELTGGRLPYGPVRQVRRPEA